MTIAGAYMLIITSLISTGKALAVLPMPDIATCEREALKFNTEANTATRQLIGAVCINAKPSS